MSQIKLKNHTSRDGFDLSRKNVFTAKIGELLPVCCIECIPGDKIKGLVQHFTRTMPVNTAAYTRIREFYDWFFVPTNLLWNKFNTFVTQMVDNNQHATGISESQVLTTQHPYFTVNQVMDYIEAMYTGQQDNMFGYDRASLTCKLLHYLGYGDYFDCLGAEQYRRGENANLNPFPLLAYQKIYQDYFRNSQWEKAYAPAFNIDYISGSQSSLNIPISILATQSNGVENMFDLRYTNWNKDLYMGVLPNAQYGDAASIFLGSSGSSDGNVLDAQINFMLNSGDSDELQTGNSSSFKWNGPVSQNGLFNNYTIYGQNKNGQNQYMFNQYITVEDMEYLKGRLGLSSSDLSASFSILALRQAEALQKWKEITQSQQQDYKNQIEAHFGVSPSDALSERCKYINGSVSNLDISEVTNTNLADGNAAEIAGKGVGVGDGRINFSTDVHGYLMCIYHAVPLLEYASDGIKRTNLKTMVTDYVIPEFDKTGMVSVPVVELTNRSIPNENFKLLGYAPRYYDMKTAVDEVHGAFINGGLGAWVAPLDYSYFMRYFENLPLDGSLTYSFFKVNPATLNPIFVAQVDSNTETDQLLINAAFNITAVRNLDRNGLPY